MAIKYDYSYEEAQALSHEERSRLVDLCIKAKMAAGCGLPQHIPQGAGAEFLLEAIDTGMEMVEKMDRDDGYYDYFKDDEWEYLSQEADGVVPVYYESLWHTWIALKGWEYDNDIFGDELPRGRGDLEKIPQQDLYDMAYKIISDVVDNPASYGFLPPEQSDRWAGEV